MFVQPRYFSRQNVPGKKGDASVLFLALELDCGDRTLLLIATLHDLEHFPSSRSPLRGYTPLAAKSEAEEAPA